MGGKGQKEYTMAPVDTGREQEMMTSMMTMMSAIPTMMSSMMSSMSSMQQPQIAQLPEIYKTEAVDWAEKNQRLQDKMRADYTLEQTRRKGRLDTIHSSPLANEEDAVTTGSIIAQ